VQHDRQERHEQHSSGAKGFWQIFCIREKNHKTNSNTIENIEII
jgi:hypothetical protein